MALSMALVSIRELSNKTRENDHLQNELHFWKGKEMKEKLVEITNPSKMKSFVEKKSYFKLINIRLLGFPQFQHTLLLFHLPKL